MVQCQSITHTTTFFVVGGHGVGGAKRWASVCRGWFFWWQPTKCQWKWTTSNGFGGSVRRQTRPMGIHRPRHVHTAHGMWCRHHRGRLLVRDGWFQLFIQNVACHGILRRSHRSVFQLGTHDQRSILFWCRCVAQRGRDGRGWQTESKLDDEL